MMKGHFQRVNGFLREGLNGDETHASTFDGTGLKFPPDKVSIQKVTLYMYK